MTDGEPGAKSPQPEPSWHDLDGDGVLDGQALDATPERPDAMPQENAQGGDLAALDADLAQVVEAWPTLPRGVRAAVLRLIRGEA